MQIIAIAYISYAQSIDNILTIFNLNFIEIGNKLMPIYGHKHITEPYINIFQCFSSFPIFPKLILEITWGIEKNWHILAKSENCKKPANDNYLLNRKRHYMSVLNHIRQRCKYMFNWHGRSVQKIDYSHSLIVYILANLFRCRFWEFLGDDGKNWHDLA